MAGLTRMAHASYVNDIEVETIRQIATAGRRHGD
jgi:hypothetical protein